jgi:cytoskeletal protein RodZ
MVITMGKKRKYLIGILLLFSALLLVYILSSFNTAPATSGEPDAVPNSPPEGAGETSTETETDTSTGAANGSATGSSTGTSSGASTESSTDSSTETQDETPSEQPDHEEQMFVVPESPLGTIGIISAFALAFGIFAHKKVR